MRVLLIMTRNVSLAVWHETGLLSRELTLYRYLCAIGWDVGFISWGDNTEIRYLHGFPQMSVFTNYFRLPSIIYSFASPFLYVNAFRRADIIKTNQVDGWWTAWLGKIITKKKMIFRCGFLLSKNYARKHGKNLLTILLYLSEKIGFKLADLIVVPTPSIKDEIVRAHNLQPNKIHIIPNFVDTKLFIPLAKQKEIRPKRVTFVGSFKVAKNPMDFLFAAQLVLDSNVEFVMVGDGPLRPEAERYAMTNQLNIKFVGRVSNDKIPAILQSSDIFVLCSHWEGHPKSILEAMSCGVAVIGYDNSGINNIIMHQENGWLCDPSYEALASAINNLLNEPRLCHSMGQKAREYIEENYSLDQIIKLELNAYKALLT